MSEPASQEARLRQHPQERFAVPQLLILAPGMQHAVAAEEEGEMLVTVHLTATNAGEAPPEK